MISCIYGDIFVPFISESLQMPAIIQRRRLVTLVSACRVQIGYIKVCAPHRVHQSLMNVILWCAGWAS